MKTITIVGVAAACVIASLTWSSALAGPPGLPPMPPPPGVTFCDCPFGAPLPAGMLPDLFDIAPDLVEEPFPLQFGGGWFAGVPGLSPIPSPPAAAFCGCPFGAQRPAEMFSDLSDLSPGLMIDFGLTDDQLGQMLLIYVDYNDRTRKARSALAGLNDEKETMMHHGKIDQARLAKLDQETIKLASEVMSEKLKMNREQLSKLRPEQIERFSQFLSKLKPSCKE